jgi:hypothetical protein
LKLHHFTATELLPAIIADGLRYGDVPTSPSEGFNAVWLTTSHKAHQQKWKEGGSLNKTAIRLTVEIPDGDPLLLKWSTFAANVVDKTYLQALHSTGGHRSDDWYIYRGIIPWPWVTAAKNMETHVEAILSEDFQPTQEHIKAARALHKAADEQLEAMKASLRKQG